MNILPQIHRIKSWEFLKVFIGSMYVLQNWTRTTWEFLITLPSNNLSSFENRK